MKNQLSGVTDLVDALTSDAVDYVDRIYGGGHDRCCNYQPSVNHRGLIYCDTCLSQIGNCTPDSWMYPFAWNDRGYDAYGPGIKHRIEEGIDLMGKNAPDTLGKRRRR